MSRSDLGSSRSITDNSSLAARHNWQASRCSFRRRSSSGASCPVAASAHNSSNSSCFDIDSSSTNDLGRTLSIFVLILEFPPLKINAPIHAAVVCVLHQPHFSSATRRVELCRRFVNFEEDNLRDIFRLTEVTQNLEGDTHNQAVIAVEQYGHRIVVPGLNMRHYLFVR